MNENSETRQQQWHPNRTYIQLANGIIIDSCFPCGNISSATITSSSPLTIEVEGNTDISFDTASKIRGYRKDKPIKFILRNANHLRKYLNQSRYRPYMMYREEDEIWQANATPIDLAIVENGQLQGSFSFQSDKFSKLSRSNRSNNELIQPKQDKIVPSTTAKQENNRGDSFFAVYQPYSCEDLARFTDQIRQQVPPIGPKSTQAVYFNEETITYSYERRKVPLLTITSASNIESFSQREPIISDQIFPNPKQRPYKLKNNPVIIVTARVHPSETYSSFFTEGLVKFLIGDSKAGAILRELFIFQILPMLNPDGVQHGNFRFDHEMRNLNRYYGQASIEKTYDFDYGRPSIRAAQLLISYFKNRNNEQCQFTQFYEETYSRLFMYIDIHGHSSAMPSFIYGNHPQKVEHLIENKMFCKLLESNCGPNGFSRFESEFSKKNMTVQEKYDEFSKLCAGRAFAGRGETPQLSLFHSYTFEVLPYWEELPRKKSDKNEKTTTAEYSSGLAKETICSLLDILDLNPQSKFSEGQLQKMRRTIARQCYNEQARKVFLFRRAESTAERSSYSEISKMRQVTCEDTSSHLNEYVLRWFNNQIFLKHLAQKVQTSKEPKLIKFYQKIIKITQPTPEQSSQSPIKKESKAKPMDSPLRSHQKIRLYQTSGRKEEEDKSSRAIQSSKCFVTREQKRAMTNEQKFGLLVKQKQRIRLQGGRINKQTIQLRQQFYEFIPRKKADKQATVRFPKREYTAKRDASRKETLDSPTKNEKEGPTKIELESQLQKAYNPIFDIKIKQIKPKPKTNIRLNTEGTPSEHKPHHETAETNNKNKLGNCNSQTGIFVMNGKIIPKQTENQNCSYHRPSFIEEFIIKIREEREGNVTNSTNKFMTRDDLRHKAMKFRPNIKEQIQEQDKKLLPVLRRNKIFTIASEPCQKEGQEWKAYQALMQSRKRTTTIDSEAHIEQLVSRTKNILAGDNKEQRCSRQSRVKKSQQCIKEMDFS